MAKRLTPADYINLGKLKEMMNQVVESDKEKGHGLDPFSHDGSYILCQTAADLYAKNMPDGVNGKDLDLFYKMGGIITFEAKKRNILNSNLDDDSKSKLISVLAEIKDKQINGVYGHTSSRKFGMFNAPIGTFKKGNGVEDDDAKKIIKLFVNIRGLSKSGAPSDEMYAAVEKTFSSWIKGIQAPALSQILHCIDPYVFPIINGQQGRDNIFLCLGAEGLGDLRAATSYASNCRAIDRFRNETYPTIRNYREFDLVGFELPRVHAATATDLLENVSAPVKATAIEEFVADESCLDGIHERREELNVFKILDITGTEIRHSRMLAWFLNPNETHSLNDKVLRSFLADVCDGASRAGLATDKLRAALEGNLLGFKVMREKNHIDLCVISDKDLVAVVVENKVFSGEHGNQLHEYKKFIAKHYGGYEAHYVYLTPHGAPSSDPNIWLSMGYDAIMESVQGAMESTGAVADNVRYLIEQYLDTVRRDVMGEDEIVELCREVYRKHKIAIDLIIRHREKFDEELHVDEAAVIMAGRLIRNLASAGNEGVFDMEFGDQIDVNHKNDFGVYAYENHQTSKVGLEAEVSIESLSRALARIWDEIKVISDSTEQGVISVSNVSDEDDVSTVWLEAMSYVQGEKAAVSLAGERCLSDYFDLSNEVRVSL